MRIVREAICRNFWRRMEMFSDAAKRKGWLTEKNGFVKTGTQTYYCQWADCAVCDGKDENGNYPGTNLPYWGTSPLPPCAEPLRTEWMDRYQPIFP